MDRATIRLVPVGKSTTHHWGVHRPTSKCGLEFARWGCNSPMLSFRLCWSESQQYRQVRHRYGQWLRQTATDGGGAQSGHVRVLIVGFSWCCYVLRVACCMLR